VATYYVYIMTHRSGTLYTGVTNDLFRRVQEHRDGRAGSFTSRYGITRLVYVEDTDDVGAALQREKQIKAWTRKKRIDLINSLNAKWEDLSEGWFEDQSVGGIR